MCVLKNTLIACYTQRKNIYSKYVCIACYTQEKHIFEVHMYCTLQTAKETQQTSIAIPTGDVKKYPHIESKLLQYMTKATTPFQRATMKEGNGATVICTYCFVVNKHIQMYAYTHVGLGKGEGRNSISSTTTFLSTTTHGSLHNRIPREGGRGGGGRPTPGRLLAIALPSFHLHVPPLLSPIW